VSKHKARRVSEVLPFQYKMTCCIEFQLLLLFVFYKKTFSDEKFTTEKKII